jgi:hypothetical protein
MLNLADAAVVLKLARDLLEAELVMLALKFAQALMELNHSELLQFSHFPFGCHSQFLERLPGHDARLNWQLMRGALKR